MAGPVKNGFRLWYRSLLAETRIDDQSKKLMGLYHVLFEKKETCS
jgi:hypothetical protein